MRTEHYIEELLYRHNCVIMPGFGAFLAQMESASIQEDTHTFYPPTKVISFNGQLSSNDGLLVSYMANVEKVSYDAMLVRVMATSKEWMSRLKAGSNLTFPNIGELSLNKEEKLQFQPADKVNYLTSSFGLSSFVSAPATREVLKEEVVELEEKIPFIITTEKRERKSFRPYFKYAAVALLAISLGFSGYRFYHENQNQQQLAQQDAQEVVTKNIQEATFFDAVPLELPQLTLNLDLLKKETISKGQHYVIAGAFRVLENAEKKVRALRKKGFDASYIGVNAYGLHQVAYDSFTNGNEAVNYLKEIKRTESVDAWLLSVK
ncbi:HU domain-containing protein [Spongiimicrobium salis]|uniref:HU domain-containing protein n=1 Tax=Spongiimicrobium salis TaxID=1667022 RepID=UPI00374D63A6